MFPLLQQRKVKRTLNRRGDLRSLPIHFADGFAEVECFGDGVRWVFVSLRVAQELRGFDHFDVEVNTAILRAYPGLVGYLWGAKVVVREELSVTPFVVLLSDSEGKRVAELLVPLDEEESKGQIMRKTLERKLIDGFPVLYATPYFNGKFGWPEGLFEVLMRLSEALQGWFDRQPGITQNRFRIHSVGVREGELVFDMQGADLEAMKIVSNSLDEGEALIKSVGS
jgi:hypothetical protein